MNFFAFPLKCQKLYKKINGASKLSYKSRNTRSPFFRSVTGGSPYKSEVGRGEACLLARGKELRTLVSLRVARGIIFIQVSSRARWAHFLFLRAAREKNCFSKQAKRHQTLLKYRLLSGGDVLDEAPLVLTYYSGFFNEMNTVNSLRLKIRWSHAPLLEILLCSHWMEKPEHLTRYDPGLTWVMDSWGWWTPGFTRDSYASHAVCTLTKYKNLLIYSNVI